MNLRRQIFIIVVVASLPVVGTPGDGWTQTPDRSPAQTPSEKSAARTPSGPPSKDGFWPTPKLLDSLLRRSADNIGSDLDLDEGQRPKFRDATAKRWGRYLTDNRASIQPVFTEFLEMRLSFDPPTKTQLEAWARRALPVFRSVRKQIDEGTDDLRGILKPKQRAKFELRRLKLAAGLAYAEAKLTLAESGQITDDDLLEYWEPTRAERQRRRDREQDHQQTAESTVNATATQESGASQERPDVIAEELTAWSEYVDSFMRTYDFDDGQRDAALSFLSELRRRALTHRDTRRAEISHLEERIAQFNGAENELAELKKQLDKLYGPIDKMFAELKRRVEAIPTARQRAAVVSRAERPIVDAPPPPSAPKP